MLAVAIPKRAIDQGTKTKILFRQIPQRPVGIGLRLRQIVLHAGDGTANGGHLCQLPARVVAVRARQPLFDVIDAAHTGIDRAGESQKAGPSEVEGGIGGVPRRRERVEPALQDRVLATLQLRVRIAVEDADPEVKVVSGDRMMEGLFREVMGQIPSSRPAMEFDDLVRYGAGEVQRAESRRRAGDSETTPGWRPAARGRDSPVPGAPASLAHPDVPITASQSEPQRRSRMLVCSRKRRVSSGRWSRTSSLR